tara:strand:+ start:191 stop:565 length:375 start_codon:yes stop_codon:yes gene_type:complete
MRIINQYHQLKIQKHAGSWNCILPQGGTGPNSGRRVIKLSSFEDAQIFKQIFDGFKLEKGGCEKNSRKKAVDKFSQTSVIFNSCLNIKWDSNSINNASMILQIQFGFEQCQAIKIVNLFIKKGR